MTQVAVLLQQEPAAFVHRMRQLKWLAPDEGEADGGLPQLDYSECKLDASQVRAVAVDLDLLLTRAKQAVLGNNEAALCGYIKLFQEALYGDERTLIAKVADNDDLFNYSMDLFRHVVVRHVVGTQAAEEMLDLFAFFSDADSIKEGVAKIVGNEMVDLMQEMNAAKPYYTDGVHTVRYNRLILTNVVNLIKHSKSNKDFFGAHIHLFGYAVTHTFDFMEQMQCVEILYRLMKHRKTLLPSARIPANLQRGIEELPNDHTLLKRIVALLDDFNMNQPNEPNIIAFPLSQATIAKKVVCSHCRVLFSPLALCIMFPELNGDNITVSFNHVRGVTMHKDRSIGFRLARFNAKLLEMLSTEMARGHNVPPTFEALASQIVDNGACINLFFSAASLAQMQQGPIQRWIIDYRQRYRDAESKRAAEANGAAGATRQPDVASRAADNAPRQQPQQRLPQQSTSRAPVSKGTSPKRSRAQMEEPQDREESEDFQPMEAYKLPALRTSDSNSRPVSAAPQPQREPPQAPAVDDDGVLLDASGFAAPRPRANAAKKTNKIIERDTNVDTGASPNKKQRTESNLAQRQRQASTASDDTQEAGSLEDMLGQLRKQIQSKVVRMRQESTRCLNDAMAEIQDEIDRVKQENRQERDQLESYFREEISTLQHMEAEYRANLGKALAELNSGLVELQSISGVIVAALDEINDAPNGDSPQSDEVVDVTTRAKTIQARELRAITEKVEAEMTAMEQAMNSYISAAPSLRFLQNYIGRKNAALALGDDDEDE